MDRKRIRNKSEPLFMGKSQTEISYMKKCEIAKACDNLPPLKKIDE